MFKESCTFQTAEQVTGFCRSPGETRKSSPTGSVVSTQSQALLTPSRQLTDAEKLRKVILELIDTERTYVKVNQILYNAFNIFKEKVRQANNYSVNFQFYFYKVENSLFH